MQTVTRLCTVFFIFVFGVTKKQNKFLDSGSYKSFPHDCYFKLLYVFVFSRMMQHRFHLAKGYYHCTGSAIIGQYMQEPKQSYHQSLTLTGAILEDVH